MDLRGCKSSSTAALQAGRRSPGSLPGIFAGERRRPRELITNPSARFDPDGTAGILNIVLKKNKLEGVSGQLQATYGTGDNHDANASLNYRTTSWSLSSNLGWNDRQSFMAGRPTASNTGRLTPRPTLVARPGDSHRGSLSGSLKAEYRGAQGWTWFTGVNANEGVRDGWDSTATAESWIGGAQHGLSTNALRVEESLSDSKGGDVFFGFEKRLGERDHKWTADVRRSHNSRLSRADFLDVSLVPDATVDEVSTFNGQDNQNTRWIAQTDFERPWGERASWSWDGNPPGTRMSPTSTTPRPTAPS